MAIFAPDIGIDLGASRTLVYVRHRGLVINEPTMLAVETKGKHNLRATGEDARLLQGRLDSEVNVYSPFANGMIKDLYLMRMMIRYFIRKAVGASWLVKPRAIITVPCSMSPLERRVVREAVVTAGARPSSVYLIEKPFAAALGCGLPVFEAQGSMVVDIGGGTTEAAVISLGGIVESRSIQMGGNRMDEAICAAVKNAHNVDINTQDAESLKLDLGAALPSIDERHVVVYASDTVTHLAKPTTVTSTLVYEALREPCQAILAVIKYVLERTPPELAGDVLKTGIHLTGGGANLPGLEQLIATSLGLPVLLAKDPGERAALGVGHLTENIELLDRVVASSFLQE